ncbi:MAG: ATP-dependent helicase [Clostridiales bacterium]|jgi:DNA helicase-2/ATP-dependent DNA helicase PcrA|nr:ATP-dependent helicase [Clostridiales bacterium]
MKPLSESQNAAVRHGKGPMMVLAGPGSGKTTVIIHRVNFLIKEMRVNPNNILVITFSKSATEEMRGRFIGLAGGVAGVTFSTFHALFFRVIRGSHDLAPGAVLSDEERRQAVKGILYAMSMETDDEIVQSVCNEISSLKNDLINIESYNPASMGADEFRQAVRAYETFKENSRRIDFDDMLVKCYDMFVNEPDVLRVWQERFPYILVDEFQDICHAQYKCVSMLAGEAGNLFIVGDDDQSIYRFRGARPEFLLRFPKDFPDSARVVLDINYRSTEQVIRLCNSVIGRNKTRYSKVMTGVGRKGPEPAVIKSEDANAEAAEIGRRVKALISKGLSPEEIAVIYRVNIQSRALTDAFMNLNIPYQVKDEAPSVYEHWISKDIYAYLRLSYDRGADECCQRIINKPKRYISNAAVAAARNAGGGIIANLYVQKQLQVWQLTRVEELLRGLKGISGRAPADAIKYIRDVVGYKDFLEEFGQYRRLNPSGLMEVLDELREAAKPFKKNEEFTAHMERAAATAKKQKLGKINERGNEHRLCVLLSTMHSAKGLEFDSVFIAGAVEGYIPHERSKTEPEIEEERRLFYVGLTRAKRYLCVSVIKKRHEADVKPTRFLDGILR